MTGDFRRRKMPPYVKRGTYLTQGRNESALSYEHHWIGPYPQVRRMRKQRQLERKLAKRAARHALKAETRALVAEARDG